MEIEEGAQSTCLCAFGGENTNPILLIGNSPNFGLGGLNPTHLNIVFAADAALFNSWIEWFNWFWGRASHLDDDIVKIPALVPATGTSEAAEKWRAYVEACRISATEKNQKVTVDPETGEVTVTGEDGEKEPNISDILELPILDKNAERRVRLYKKGDLVTVDKGSRIPPLYAQMRPE